MQIEIIDASIAYGDMIVFEHFTASIAAQRVTALVGPSGSGKSSLLAAMAGFQRLRAGEIFIQLDGDTEHSPPLSSEVAWVPQGSNALGARSSIDNVMIAGLSQGISLGAAREEATHALEMVGLGSRSDQLAKTLSGGELQRLALARALAAHKGAVFADEPSANLDEANTREVASILRGLSEKATIVVATHDPFLMAAADDVIYVRPPA
ncbi:MAG TPA: ATP-binding cassette domain-containing protein [Galbitalea sp.]|jgi:ABC-type lipoprotein export system ATPase subunit|nr:ATP-binding cassette domain-containing protein [Galbitalea sp.]